MFLPPEKNIVKDEATVSWRGNMSLRDYNPDKPDKFGIKYSRLILGQELVIHIGTRFKQLI